MTVSVETNRVVYIGAGITGPFSITFPFLVDADIKVFKTLIASPFTETLLALSTDYSLVGAGAASGTLTLVAALPATHNLTIYRDPAVTQPIDYLPNDGFPSETHERGLDRLTMICNRFRDLLSRAFRLSDGDTSGINLTMPTPLAGTVLAVNAARTALEWVIQAGNLSVTAYGQLLLNTASAITARLLLGFAAIAAKGDLHVGTAADTIGTLSVGANGTVLTADSAAAAGVAWAVTGFTTGDVKVTIKTVADPGWVVMNDGTMGSAASGGTTRANADTLPLYTLMWNNTTNANCAVSTGRGANAAADFAANKTIALPKALGRALAVQGAGAGLTSRAVAEALGFEDSINVTHNHVITDVQHSHGVTVNGAPNIVVAGSGAPNVGSGAVTDWYSGGSVTINNSFTGITGTASSGSSGTGRNMPPETFFPVHMKL